ncbi:hypothetical protein NQK81_11925 [Amycolatopsis roodepoortensis]|uniref:hypothetical protein n=1 Tax=Amycolatopsis roodepoortensis TaxID=700274 RepID=UPI00214BD504|nr:hypothetical protein [Amycolatopsis roodepoortensis]UUV34119.1 hypothetical protein NQK81_11925 [Amycolatopsis roodepoortensis]
MPDDVPGARWRFALAWGTLEVFADGDTIPAVLRPTAAVLARLDGRFRPALLSYHRSPTRIPLAAVWPTGLVPAENQLEGVVLAEVHDLTCQCCAARFHGVYPDGGIPHFGSQLSAHRLVNGCPSCGSDFARSRIQSLALLPVTGH